LIFVCNVFWMIGHVVLLGCWSLFVLWLFLAGWLHLKGLQRVFMKFILDFGSFLGLFVLDLFFSRSSANSRLAFISIINT
jgi:hypothetical protein